MCAARSRSPPPVRKLGKGKFWEGANGEGNRRGRLPLPLSRNATRISASPAMPRWSSRANVVVDFVSPGPGRSSGAYPRATLRPILCKNATEPRKPNDQKNAGPSQWASRLPNVPLMSPQRTMSTLYWWGVMTQQKGFSSITLLASWEI
jgi:hypothetical protein